MQIKIKNTGFGGKDEYTIEISDEKINHFIDRFGEQFGKAIVKGLED